jgi:hypothetical protein
MAPLQESLRVELYLASPQANLCPRRGPLHRHRARHTEEAPRRWIVVSRKPNSAERQVAVLSLYRSKNDTWMFDSSVRIARETEAETQSDEPHEGVSRNVMGFKRHSSAGFHDAIGRESIKLEIG